MKLTVIRGVPGSGKSTFAKERYNCLILENDMFYIRDGEYQWSKSKMDSAVKWCFDTAQRALESGMDVCVANTFTKARFIDVYRDMAGRLGADFEVIRLDGDPRWTNSHSVPPGVMKSMRDGFEPYPGERVFRFGGGLWSTANHGD